MCVKLNGCYFILSQKGHCFHRLSLTFLLKKIHIKTEYVTKFLGVFTNENLSWKQHIDIVSSKISKSIDILYKSRDALSKQCLKQSHFSFIRNYVNQSNIAWVSASKSKLERLYRCQKHAACIIYMEALNVSS